MTATHAAAVLLLAVMNAAMIGLMWPVLRDGHRRRMERVRRDTGGPLRGTWAVPIPSQRDGRSWP